MLKRIELCKDWYKEKIAEWGDDIGEHSEAVYFIQEVGFVLGVYDVRIGVDYYWIDKKDFMLFMDRFYDEQIIFCDAMEVES